MLDLKRLRSVKLRRTPPGQLVMAATLLRLDYRLPRRTRIELVGADEHLDRNKRYIFAMNHTDRFNYWPFQWQLWHEKRGYTATWVKGKYYENEWIGRFMDLMNNIPLPSRGYVFSSQFKQLFGRPPLGAEYRLLRDIVDGVHTASEKLPADASDDVRAFIGGDPPAQFLTRFEATFDQMVREVVRLCREAMELGNHLLVFPEGTRSIRLSKGHIGLAQIAQHLQTAIVPVGCNGSHHLYPGNSPFSAGGRVVYRIGAPILPTDPAIEPYAVPRDVLPFTRQADVYRERYEKITEVVMARIAELLDPDHLPHTGATDENVAEMDRFL